MDHLGHRQVAELLTHAHQLIDDGFKLSHRLNLLAEDGNQGWVAQAHRYRLVRLLACQQRIGATSDLRAVRVFHHQELLRQRSASQFMDLVAEVKSWTQSYKQLKKLLREVSRQSLELIRGHVANQRAAKRPGIDGPLTAQALVRVVRAAFPRLNAWLNGLPDPRAQEMCLYTAAHLWWHVISTFLSRTGSRNGFDL